LGRLWVSICIFLPTNPAEEQHRTSNRGCHHPVHKLAGDSLPPVWHDRSQSSALLHVPRTRWQASNSAEPICPRGSRRIQPIKNLHVDAISQPLIYSKSRYPLPHPTEANKPRTLLRASWPLPNTPC
jgi:hypothetical protein